MAQPRNKHISTGSVTLQVMLEPRLETKKLATLLRKGTDLVSRWATGDRKPTPPDRAALEDEVQIPWRDWDDELSDEQAEALTLKLRSKREASAEPTPAFPADGEPANGGTGHAA